MGISWVSRKDQLVSENSTEQSELDLQDQTPVTEKPVRKGRKKAIIVKASGGNGFETVVSTEELSSNRTEEPKDFGRPSFSLEIVPDTDETSDVVTPEAADEVPARMIVKKRFRVELKDETDEDADTEVSSESMEASEESETDSSSSDSRADDESESVSDTEVGRGRRRGTSCRTPRR